jgi:2-dehydropantoate 2-reductase
MEIKTVSIIGLGALGVLFGHRLSGHMPHDDLRIIADPGRIAKYRSEGVFCNGEVCDFNYLVPGEKSSPADLLIFAVKFTGLKKAIEDAANQVGPDTIIISLLNGISSENIIGRVYGDEKVLLTVAQGMDAVKVGNRLTYKNMGMICFGDRKAGSEPSEKVRAVARFFDKTNIPYLVDTDMQKRLWGKFMLNVGVNQTVAVFEGDYGTIQKDGPARDTMIAAMREVLALSEKENVRLTEADLDYWLHILDGLNPSGKPSMRQDLEAGRKSEVGLFAGTVLALGEKHGLPCPVNRMLYERIMAAESRFGKE